MIVIIILWALIYFVFGAKCFLFGLLGLVLGGILTALTTK